MLFRSLLSSGATVVLWDKKNESVLNTCKKKLQTLSRRPVTTAQVDITDEHAVVEVVTRIGKQFSHIDVLINNAGVMCHPRAKTVDGFEIHLQTNYLGMP